MSAGTGVTHSEFNPSQESPVHLLQIWVLPDHKGHTPGYEQKHFSNDEKRGKLRLIASQNGEENSVSLNQDVNIYSALLDGNESVSFALETGRVAWLHVARGTIDVNGQTLEAGDSASMNESTSLHFADGDKSEVLLFDMAA